MIAMPRARIRLLAPRAAETPCTEAPKKDESWTRHGKPSADSSPYHSKTSANLWKRRKRHKSSQELRIASLKKSYLRAKVSIPSENRPIDPSDAAPCLQRSPTT